MKKMVDTKSIIKETKRAINVCTTLLVNQSIYM